MQGWLIGYDGSFEFENIGDNYHKFDVPYIGLRALPAILGSLTPPVIYGIMRESGYPRIVAILSAMLIVFGEWTRRIGRVPRREHRRMMSLLARPELT